MAYRNTLETYGSVAKWFHWIIALLVIAMLSIGFFMGDFSKEYKPTIYGIHKLIGVTILFLMLSRGLWRLTNITPFSALSSFEEIASRAVHFTLYLSVILMCLVGWMGAVAGGRPPYLGNIPLNLPIPLNKTFKHVAFDLHYALAIIIIIAVTLHILGALYHHFIRKDNVLKRMLPG